MTVYNSFFSLSIFFSLPLPTFQKGCFYSSLSFSHQIGGIPNFKKVVWFERFNSITMHTAQKIFGKCDQIRRKLQIWSHFLNKSLMENFIFCVVTVV